MPSSLFSLLSADLRLYQSSWRSPNIYVEVLYILFVGIRSRDFRLNILTRLQSAKIPLLSRLCHSLIFYLYGSTIDPRATLNSPIRFTHARNIVIGRNVCMHGSYSIIFHNVTLGKLRPGSPSEKNNMPIFLGNVVLGTGTTVLGHVVVGDNVVFAAHAFCNSPTVPPSSTYISKDRVLESTYFHPNAHPDFPPTF